MSVKEAPSQMTSSNKRTSRIAIIDDHPILREGMTIFLNHHQPEFKVVGGAETAEQAVGLVEKLKPDAIFLDISLKGSNGIEAIKNIKAVSPDLAILVLSMHDETIYASRALKAGALGYVMKHESPETLLIALRKIVQGEIYLSEAMGKQMLSDIMNRSRPNKNSPLKMLSDRELEVFTLIGKGTGTRDIAKQLTLSVKTVESHRLRLRRKLGIKTGTQLVHYAINWVGSGDFGGMTRSGTECDSLVEHCHLVKTVRP